jgi:thiol-disulfide isomerase/thioredoxin
VRTQHEAEENIVGRGLGPTIHDQSIFLMESRLSMDLGITRWLGLGIMVPFRVVATRITYRDPDTGDELQLASPEIHHRNETLTGLADPWITAHLAWARDRWALDGRIGITLPLGSTVDDPYVLGALGLPHEHIQFGTGTVDPLVRLAVQRWFAVGTREHAWSLGAWAFTQQVLYESERGYQAGSRYAGGLLVESPLTTRRWDFLASFDAQGEAQERWHGVVHTEEGNNGRVDLLAGATASVNVWRTLALNASLKVPVYTYVVGGQVSYPLIVALGLSGYADFGAAAHEHHHREEEHAAEAAADDDYTCPMHPDVSRRAPGECPDCHMALVPRASLVEAPPPDWSGLDVRAIAEHGEAVELFPVAGKLTVFDFHAPWCRPCHALERELAAIARRHPGRIAVRTVNIVDWESPAARRYLAPGRFNLPHLRIADRDGNAVFARSGAPEELARAVEELLGAR